MFGAAAAKPVVEEAPQITEAGEGEPKPQEPQIREFFDPANRDKVVPILKHLAEAERVLLAVENMDEA